MNTSNNNLYLRLDSLSSLNNIATTNPITNQISIPGFGETNIYILLKRKYPQELLSVYLHEITHYNCFDSYLGMVFFHLGLEINKLYFQIKNNELFSKQNNELHTQLSELVIRYNFIIEFIRPFAEGIALFAQFDDYLGDSECFSKTSMHVFENFIDSEYIDSFNFKEMNKQNLQQLINTFLLCNRLSEDSIHEKFNLLTQPFSCSNKFASDYLPGYVFVKTLWAGSTIGNKCSNFSNI